MGWEIFCSYMMFEYRGAVTSFEKLIETQKSTATFLTEIEKFYLRERLCLLLCSQVIIAGNFDDEHPHQVDKTLFQNPCFLPNGN